MLKILKSFAVLTLIVLLCGCSIQTKGNDLKAFCERINKNGDYKIELNGFIKEKNEYRKYFISGEYEILLSLTADEKNRTTAMDIVLPAGAEKDESTAVFCGACVKAFVNDDKVYETLGFAELFSRIDLSSPKAKQTDVENIGLLIDSLSAGTVITVNKKR